MSKAKQQKQDEVDDAVGALLEVVTSKHYDSKSEDIFTECHICGKWEEHAEDCFVPALERWINSPSQVKMEEY